MVQILKFSQLLSGYIALGVFLIAFSFSTLSAQELFILDDGNARIYKMDPDLPNQAQVLSMNIGRVGGIAIDPTSGDLYYTVGTVGIGGGIKRANSDGTNITDIVTGLSNPSGLDFNSATNELFFIQIDDPSTPSIYKVDNSGSGSATLVVAGITGSGPVDLAVDAANGFVYWTDSRGPTIRRIPVGGGTEDIVVDSITGTVDGIAIDSDNSTIYWLNPGSNTIESANITSPFPISPTLALSDSSIGSGGLAVNGTISPTQLYWANSSGSSISTGPVGGSVTLLLDISDGVASPVDLSLYPLATPTPTQTATPVSEILTPGTTLLSPPNVSVNGRNATITLQNFTSVIATNPALAEAFGRLEAAGELTFRYDVRVTAERKKDNINKLSKSNELTLKRLNPGNYSVNYTANAYSKKSRTQIQKAADKGKTGFTAKFKKIYSTNRSPSASFTISK